MVTVRYNFNDITSWLKSQEDHFNVSEIEKFSNAIDLASQYYQGQKFYPTDVDLLAHALTCAVKVAKLNLLSEAVIATILFALPKFSPSWRDEVEQFGDKVIELIDGVNRVSQIRKLGSADDIMDEEQKKHQVEAVRKMFLAMASDIRVVLIVLVGRGELMLNLKSCDDPTLQRRIALETVEIFAPLANRLGVGQIKWELEDLSFKYLHPDQYKKIAKCLDETREERLQYIEKIKQFLSSQMEEGNIKNFQIMGRAKHIYSIWRKMKKKNYDFDDLYDIHAVRILVPEVKDCYTVLGIVHTNYSPLPGEFDDYISNPKSNNYQSLHTCVIGPENKVVEVQIRTFAQHDHAEYGIAAHWMYKESSDKNFKNSEAFAEKVAWLRQILEWREELTHHNDISEIFKNEIFADTIYVLTPQGKVISLPNGSTPLDFAYAIHSDIGHRCRGAKIDGQIIPLATALKNGQRVEILTLKDGAPSLNWIHDGLVKSSKAINHIRRYFRNLNNEAFINVGKEVFDRELNKFASQIRPSIQEVLAKLGYENEKALHIDLGKGDLLPQELREAINNIISKKQVVTPPGSLTLAPTLFNTPSFNRETKGSRQHGIIVEGVSGIDTNLARCCKPIPGDEVVGFITQNNGIAIHRNNCFSIKRQAKKSPEKIINASWGNASQNSKFSFDLEVIAYDHSSLLRDLTDLFTLIKLKILGLRTVCKSNKTFMLFTISISGVDFNYTNLFNQVRAINGVIEVSRK